MQKKGEGFRVLGLGFACRDVKGRRLLYLAATREEGRGVTSFGDGGIVLKAARDVGIQEEQRAEDYVRRPHPQFQLLVHKPLNPEL